MNQFMQPIVAASVNGTDGNYIIDTGLTFTTLYKTTADRLGVSEIAKGSSYTIHGIAPFSRGLLTQISLANLQMQNYYCGIESGESIRRFESAQAIPFTDGMIGGDILKQFRCVLDFSEKKIVFIEPSKTLAPSKGRLVARLIATPMNGVGIEGKINGIDVFLEVDTGNNDFASLYDDIKPIGDMPRVNRSAVGQTAAGTYKTTQALLIQNFEVNGIVATKVISGIVPAKYRPRRPASERRTDGLLGLPFFVNNNLIIDYGRMEVRQAVSR